MSEKSEDPKSDNECKGDCGSCLHKTFDNQDSYEFICDKYGFVVR